MGIEITFTTGIVEAGTCEFSTTLAPQQPDGDPDAAQATPPRDTVLTLGSSVLAPGLSTPVGR